MSLSWGNLVSRGDGPNVERFLFDADIANDIFEYEAILLKSALFGCLEKFINFPNIVIKSLQHLQDCHLLAPPGITDEELSVSFDVFLFILAKWMNKHDVVLNTFQLLSMIADRQVMKDRSILVEQGQLLCFVNDAIAIHHQSRTLQRAALQLFESILENTNPTTLINVSTAIFMPVLDNLSVNFEDVPICYSSLSILAQLVDYNANLMSPWQDQIISITLVTIGKKLTAEVTAKCLVLLGKLQNSSFLYSRVSRHKRGLFLFTDAMSILAPHNLPSAIIALQILLHVLEDNKLCTLVIKSNVRQQPHELSRDLLSDLTNKYEKYLSSLSEDEEQKDNTQIEEFIFLFSRIEELLQDIILMYAPIITTDTSEDADSSNANPTPVEVQQQVPPEPSPPCDVASPVPALSIENTKEELDMEKVQKPSEDADTVVSRSESQESEVDDTSHASKESIQSADKRLSQRMSSLSLSLDDHVDNIIVAVNELKIPSLDKFSDSEDGDDHDGDEKQDKEDGVYGVHDNEDNHSNHSDDHHQATDDDDEFSRDCADVLDHDKDYQSEEEDHCHENDEHIAYDENEDEDHPSLSGHGNNEHQSNSSVSRDCSELLYHHEDNQGCDQNGDEIDDHSHGNNQIAYDENEDEDQSLSSDSYHTNSPSMSSDSSSLVGNNPRADREREVDSDDEHSEARDSYEIAEEVDNAVDTILDNNEDDRYDLEEESVDGSSINELHHLEKENEEDKQEVLSEEDSTTTANTSISDLVKEPTSQTITQEYLRSVASSKDKTDGSFCDKAETKVQDKADEKSLLQPSKSFSRSLSSEQNSIREPVLINPNLISSSNGDSVSPSPRQNSVAASYINAIARQKNNDAVASASPLTQNQNLVGKRRKQTAPSARKAASESRVLDVSKSNSIFNILKANRQLFKQQQQSKKKLEEESALAIDLSKCSPDSSIASSDNEQENDHERERLQDNGKVPPVALQSPQPSPIRHSNSLISASMTIDSPRSKLSRADSHFEFHEVYSQDSEAEVQGMSSDGHSVSSSSSQENIIDESEIIKVNPEYLQQLHDALQVAEDDAHKAKEKTQAIHSMFKQATNKIEVLIGENDKLSERLLSLVEQNKMISDVVVRQNKLLTDQEQEKEREKEKKEEIQQTEESSFVDDDSVTDLKRIEETKKKPKKHTQRVIPSDDSLSTIAETKTEEEEADNERLRKRDNKRTFKKKESRSKERAEPSAEFVTPHKNKSSFIESDQIPSENDDVSKSTCSTSRSKRATKSTVESAIKSKNSLRTPQRTVTTQSVATPSMAMATMTQSKDDQDRHLIITAVLEAIDYCQAHQFLSIPPYETGNYGDQTPLPPYNQLSFDLRENLLQTLHQLAKSVGSFFHLIADMNVNPNPQTRQSTHHHHSALQPIVSIHALQSYLIKMKLIDNTAVTLQDAYLIFNKFRAKHLTLFGTTFSIVLLAQKYFASASYGVVNYIAFLNYLQDMMNRFLMASRQQQLTQVNETIERELLLTSREFSDIVKLMQKEVKPLLILYESYLPYVSNKHQEAGSLAFSNTTSFGLSSSLNRSKTLLNSTNSNNYPQRVIYEKEIINSLGEKGQLQDTARIGSERIGIDGKEGGMTSPMHMTDLQTTVAVRMTPHVTDRVHYNDPLHDDEDPSHLINSIPFTPLPSQYDPSQSSPAMQPDPYASSYLHSRSTMKQSQYQYQYHRIHLSSQHMNKFQVPHNVFHYYVPSSLSANATPIPKCLTFSEIVHFAKEFQITPSMYSRPQLYEIFRSTLFPPHSNGSSHNDEMEENDNQWISAANLQLNFPMFVDFIVLTALRCPLFRATNSPVTKLHNFLMLLNVSSGKQLVAKRNRNKEVVVFKPVLPSSLASAPEEELPEEFLRNSLGSPFATRASMNNTIALATGGRSRSPSPPLLRGPKSLSYYDPYTQSITQTKRKKSVEEMRYLMTGSV